MRSTCSRAGTAQERVTGGSYRPMAASTSTTIRSNWRSDPWRSAARINVFASSEGGGVRWATVCSLMATAKLNDVKPFAYLKDVLERMSEGHPMNRLDDLLPWNWTQMPVNQ